MKDGLILGDDLKMTNVVNMTVDRVKNLKMADLDMILMGLNESEKKMMIDAIRDLAGNLTEKGRANRYERIGHIVEMVAYRVQERKAWAQIKGAE